MESAKGLVGTTMHSVSGPEERGPEKHSQGETRRDSLGIREQGQLFGSVAREERNRTSGEP